MPRKPDWNHWGDSIERHITAAYAMGITGQRFEDLWEDAITFWMANQEEDNRYIATGTDTKQYALARWNVRSAVKAMREDNVPDFWMLSQVRVRLANRQRWYEEQAAKMRASTRMPTPEGP